MSVDILEAVEGIEEEVSPSHFQQASIFSLQYDPWNKHEIRENRGDDH